MKTLHEIVKASAWTDVWDKLLEFYPDQKKYHILFKEDYETIRDTAPVPVSDWMLVLEDVVAAGGDAWTEVYMISSEGDGRRRSTDCVPWKEVLAMKVYGDGGTRSNAEIVAHVLLDHASSCF